jgi:hypothetical protein
VPKNEVIFGTRKAHCKMTPHNMERMIVKNEATYRIHTFREITISRVLVLVFVKRVT